jgi:hypothetical protein
MTHVTPVCCNGKCESSINCVKHHAYVFSDLRTVLIFDCGNTRPLYEPMFIQHERPAVERRADARSAA